MVRFDDASVVGNVRRVLERAADEGAGVLRRVPDTAVGNHWPIGEDAVCTQPNRYCC
ncbi:MAG: hypothetical protein HC767_06375 [Akkermansiaceae bacterium]|nr:hypothetical protein [Akkermansiaceae bacterium]